MLMCLWTTAKMTPSSLKPLNYTRLFELQTGNTLVGKVKAFEGVMKSDMNF